MAFEYHTETWTHDYWEHWKSISFRDWANEFGRDGWEMVSVAHAPDDTMERRQSSPTTCTFKRLVADGQRGLDDLQAFFRGCRAWGAAVHAAEEAQKKSAENVQLHFRQHIFLCHCGDNYTVPFGIISGYRRGDMHSNGRGCRRIGVSPFAVVSEIQPESTRESGDIEM